MEKEKPNSTAPKIVEIDLTKLTLPELTQQTEQIEQVCTSRKNFYVIHSDPEESSLFEVILPKLFECSNS